jgi:hypothetical protein
MASEKASAEMTKPASVEFPKEIADDLPINRPDFTQPISPPPGPTVAQQNWMRSNPRYVRTSHTPARFDARGTLHPDGSFIPEDVHPVMDGNGSFGVGIPLGSRR